MTLREWLLLAGTLIIVLIVLDGARRMYRERQESLKISRGMGAGDIKDSPLDDLPNPDLSLGAARIVPRDAVSAPVERQKPERQNLDKATSPVASGRLQAEDASSDASFEREGLSAEPADRWEAPLPLINAGKKESASAPRPVFGSSVDSARAGDSARVGVSSSGEESLVAESADSRGRSASSMSESVPVESAQATPAPEKSVSRFFGFGRRQESVAATVAEPEPVVIQSAELLLAGSNRPPAQEVIIINVHARSERSFPGSAVKQLLEACGLEHGDRDIYHRHEEVDLRSPVQFSVASAVHPGTLIPGELPAQEIKGLSFFMSMPGPSDSLKAFDFMLETAQCVVKNLGGELKDERRSVMTGQTIEHCRQRIREYERKRRSVRA